MGKIYMSSNGAYAGFSTLSTAETWVIDAKGNVKNTFAAGYASSGGAPSMSYRNHTFVTHRVHP